MAEKTLLFSRDDTDGRGNGKCGRSRIAISYWHA